MQEFVGDAHSVALQKSLMHRHTDIAHQPHLSNGGRILNVIDPDGFGWDNLRQVAMRDGFVALAMVDHATCQERLHAEFGSTVTAPSWGVFKGAAPQVLAQCEQLIAAKPLPKGWRLTVQTHLDDATIGACQDLHELAQVSAFPAYYMRGDAVRCCTACIWDDAGALAACALAWMRFHGKSRFANWLYAGAVAVHPAHRRRGLGTLANGAVLQDSHRAYGWNHVAEYARATNLASVGMLNACGLDLAPSKATFVLDLTGTFHTS